MGGMLRISKDGDDPVGAKNQNLQKLPGLPTKPPKNPCQISSDCFEYPKKFLLKSSHPKNTYPKKPGIENFKP